jgi:hypothetical protein
MGLLEQFLELESDFKETRETLFLLFSLSCRAGFKNKSYLLMYGQY